jgi:hypothetical protein
VVTTVPQSPIKEGTVDTNTKEADLGIPKLTPEQPAVSSAATIPLRSSPSILKTIPSNSGWKTSGNAKIPTHIPAHTSAFQTHTTDNSRSISCAVRDCDIQQPKRPKITHVGTPIASKSAPSIPTTNVYMDHETLDFTTPIDMLYVLYLQESQRKIAKEYPPWQTNARQYRCISVLWRANMTKHEFIMSDEWKSIDISFISTESLKVLINAIEQYRANHAE